MGRATSGVHRACGSPTATELLGMHVVRDGADVLVATGGGYAKRTPTDQYPVQGRGGLGVVTARIVDARGELIGALMVQPEDEVFAITSAAASSGRTAAEIKQSGRQTMGVRLVNLAPGRAWWPSRGSRGVGSTRPTARAARALPRTVIPRAAGVTRSDRERAGSLVPGEQPGATQHARAASYRCCFR